MKIINHSPPLVCNVSKGYKLANEIVDQIAEEWGLTREQVIGPRRFGVYVKCRREIAHHLRHRCGLSLLEIAHTLDRDHTSIMNLLRGNKSASTC